MLTRELRPITPNHPAIPLLLSTVVLAACGGQVQLETEQDERQVASVEAFDPMCQASEPSDACNECTRRAIAGPCAELLEACHDQDEDECVVYGQCQFECFGEADCCVACSSELPSGFRSYASLQTCSVCEQCAAECDGLFPALCGE